MRDNTLYRQKEREKDCEEGTMKTEKRKEDREATVGGKEREVNSERKKERE